jgi:hypothetical protein
VILPEWVASVEHGEVEFGPLNEAARRAAVEDIAYPWGKPLVEVSKIVEQLRSDEMVALVAKHLRTEMSDEECIALAQEILYDITTPRLVEGGRQ